MKDSELQEELLDSGIMAQVQQLFEKISPSKKVPWPTESYKFIILDLGDDRKINLEV